MLKTIVQQVELRPEFRLGQLARLITVLPKNNRNLESARNQERFISKLFGRAARIHEEHPTRPSAIPAREYVEFHAARLQQLPQQDHERRLTSASHREIADADHRTAQNMTPQRTAII